MQIYPRAHDNLPFPINIDLEANKKNTLQTFIKNIIRVPICYTCMIHFHIFIKRKVRVVLPQAVGVFLQAPQCIHTSIKYRLTL